MNAKYLSKLLTINVNSMKKFTLKYPQTTKLTMETESYPYNYKKMSR